MSKIVFDISVSLDGYITATGVTPEQPTGPGGEVLNEWYFDPDPATQDVLGKSLSSIGAIVCGRRTYDTSVPWWQADGPTGEKRLPVFVLTHAVPDTVPDNGVYHFATDGLDDALAQAKQAAGDRSVAVMGGANVIQQCLNADVVDEIGLHLVPVLFGSGTRLFDALAIDHRKLAVQSVVDTSKATHLLYRVIR